MQEARDAREAIVGSFDVLIARGGHRTNEIMKVLTLTSVILLPGALIAGVMGMNFKVGLFDEPMLFWVVVAAIAAIAPVTIFLAKSWKWTNGSGDESGRGTGGGPLTGRARSARGYRRRRSARARRA